jgi:hypothetical protein
MMLSLSSYSLSFSSSSQLSVNPISLRASTSLIASSSGFLTSLAHLNYHHCQLILHYWDYHASIPQLE